MDSFALARVWPEPGKCMWQATAHALSGGSASSAGGVVSHTFSANGQRVRKRHPDGGRMGLGASPLNGAWCVRRRGSIDGIAEMSARV